MNINFTGRHVEVTDALRQYALEKIARIHRHYDKITSIQVTLGVEKLLQKAEAELHVPNGKTIFAESESSDMYASIDALAEKLERQVLKHKEKEKDHR
jgi:putative sigma-54 modulation protein